MFIHTLIKCQHSRYRSRSKNNFDSSKHLIASNPNCREGSRGPHKRTRNRRKQKKIGILRQIFYYIASLCLFPCICTFLFVFLCFSPFCLSSLSRPSHSLSSAQLSSGRNATQRNAGGPTKETKGNKYPPTHTHTFHTQRSVGEREDHAWVRTRVLLSGVCVCVSLMGAVWDSFCFS